MTLEIKGVHHAPKPILITTNRLEDLMNLSLSVVFSKDYCQQCRMVERLLNNSSTEFIEINLDHNPNEVRDYLRELGWQATPVTYFHGEGFSGFNPSKVKGIIAATKEQKPEKKQPVLR